MNKSLTSDLLVLQLFETWQRAKTQTKKKTHIYEFSMLGVGMVLVS